MVANEIFRFIEEVSEAAEGILIHSVKSHSRSCCALSAYLMKKYSWGLDKTLEFVKGKRSDCNLRPTLLQQLSNYEKRLLSQSKKSFTYDWDYTDFSDLGCEELQLRNTHINSQNGCVNGQSRGGIQAMFDDDARHRSRRLTWADHSAGDRSLLVRPTGSNQLMDHEQNQSILKSSLKKQGNTRPFEDQCQQTPSTQASSSDDFLGDSLNIEEEGRNCAPCGVSVTAKTLTFQTIQAPSFQRQAMCGGSRNNGSERQSRASRGTPNGRRFHSPPGRRLATNAAECRSPSPTILDKRRHNEFPSGAKCRASSPMPARSTAVSVRPGSPVKTRLNETARPRNRSPPPNCSPPQSAAAFTSSRPAQVQASRRWK